MSTIHTIEYQTEATTAADADELVMFDNSAGKTRKVGLDTLRAQIAAGVVNATAATLAATQLAHGGQTVTLNRAAGVTVTLPAASGTGARLLFVVGTTTTSNGYIIQVADASTTMTGTAILLQDAADTVVGFETAADSDTITLNGSTTGGIKGDSVEVIDIAANLWFARVLGSATGTEATPFSAAVS